MALKVNFTSLRNFVFYYISFRLFTEGVEEFLIQPTAWYYMKFLGESNLFLGLTLAGYSAGALLFAPVVGVLEIKFEASKILTVMCALVRFVGNLLYSIPINGYFPMVGRFICGLGAGTEGILFGVITKGTTCKNRAKAFLYLEGLYCLGTTCGPIFGSILTFKIDIFGWKINAGNSPGFILMLIWFTFLMFALFLPSDLAENTGDERSLIDSGSDSPSYKPITERDKRRSSSSMIRRENSAGGLGSALFDDDSEDGYNLSKSLALHGCPPSSMVFCLYYLICLSLFVYMVISFYVPLLAKYNLGLELIHVQLIYLNSSLFSFVLFLATPLILKNICETTFLFVSIFSQIIPISSTFLIALSWNSPMSVEKKSYLVLCSMMFLSAQLLNSPVASCLLSKLTPVKSASFYQSLTYTAVHMGICLSRLAGGSTFGKMAMMHTCIVLAICWLFGMMWLGYEYRKFGRVADG